MNLQPQQPVQTELYKLYSVLVEVVQLAPAEFTVVDPHDFIEVLSWSDTVGAGDAQVIRRLRTQTTMPDRTRRKLLIPFSLDADVFLAVVDLGATVFRILDPRTDADLRTREQDDGFETSTFVWEFIRTLFPDECPVMVAWTILFERTVQGPVPINEDGIVSGRYVDEFGGPIQLRSILPFFFEVLRIVCNVETRTRIHDVALLKRLFACFEGSPRLKASNIIEQLRERSKLFLSRSLEGRVRSVLTRDDVNFRQAVVSTRPDSGGHCTPTDLFYLKISGQSRAFKAMTESHSAAQGLLEQYGQVRIVLEALTARCVMIRTAMHYSMLNQMIAGWYYCVNGQREIWKPQAALNQFRSRGLNALAARLHNMKSELDHWLRLLNDHMDSTRMR